MVSLILQALVICSTTWFLWKLFRGLFVKTDLDRIPGPPSPSFLYGMHTSFPLSECLVSQRLMLVKYIGNLKELYSRQGWAFHRGLGEEYGPVVRLRGKFGVRAKATASGWDATDLCGITAKHIVHI